MTIHKSKGLEFDTVILAGLHRRPKADTAPLMRFEYAGGELLLGPIKQKVSDEHDPVSVYLAARDKQRGAYEADRLLYVALTRARQQLHLIGVVELDDGMVAKPPETSSLLGRLWNYMAPPHIPDASDLEGGGGASDESPRQRFLLRMAEQHIPDGGPVPAVPRHMTSWNWRPDAGHENVIGTVAHAWLERIGKDGIGNWSVERVDESLPVFRKQLSRAGLMAAAVPDAVQVLRDTLAATLASPKGQWLLWAARAHREWSLLDVSGRVSVIDLAISQESDWLVVDYKTGVPHADESSDAFATRMRERYREQIQRYCAHVSALDGRPARGALYFPRADVWVDY